MKQNAGPVAVGVAVVAIAVFLFFMFRHYVRLSLEMTPTIQRHAFICQGGKGIPKEQSKRHASSLSNARTAWCTNADGGK